MPVQQHPIPQNVTSYQFRLVGDLTLKQFLQLAVGIIFGIVIYATPLPFFFKYPLIALVVGTGAAIAFLPVQGRPLDQWIVAFIRSIYQPTIYTWQKPADAESTKLDFTPTSTYTQAFQTQQQQGKVPSQPIPFQPSTSPQVMPNQPTTTPTQSQLHPTLTPQIHVLTRKTMPPQAISPEEPIKESEHVTRSARTVHIAPIKPTPVEKQTHSAVTTPVAIAPKVPVTTTPTTPTPLPTKPGTTVTFSQQLPIPHTPQTPNTLVGMTLSPDGKILDSAIVEVLKDGQTIRATKSNKLGQFLFAKPLDDGTYQITAEKEGFTFPRFDLKLENKIIPPIKLQATRKK